MQLKIKSRSLHKSELCTIAAKNVSDYSVTRLQITDDWSEPPK